MHSLKKKMKKQGGFTLVEMLVVVAIIAILIAVSIPVVNSALEKSRIATDAANERAAKAAFLVSYLTEEDFGTGGTKQVITPNHTETYYYDAVNGKVVTTAPTEGYGKCTTNTHGGAYIQLQLTDEYEVTVTWSAGSGSHNGVVPN